jgi:hypothetical protein
MTGPQGSHQGRRLGARTRTASSATLVVFLLAQLWVMCPAMCLLHGHPVAATTAASGMSATMACHPDRALRDDVPPPLPVGAMLPSSATPALVPLRVAAAHFRPPTLFGFQQVPAAEPPPPRLS